ncbi:MAG: FkbM family methyltransferase [Pirellulaceae bacterium]
MIGRLMQSAAKRMARACGMCAVPRSGRLSLETSLEKWTKRDIGGVIDVGASDGRWTELVMRHFPAADYLLIEAQGGPHEEKLRALKARHRNVDYLIAAAGDHEGVLHFDARDPFGGLASDTPFESGDIEVPAVTIDRVVEERGLPGPYLLKLDTHGFETPIFEGARRTLEQTSLIIVEVYNFTLCDGALRFPEMCAFLGERGFRPLDLFDVMHRPKDGALWQFDLLLGRADDKEFSSNCYD